WKTVRLEHDTLQDYCQRPGSPITSVAELYHENSKLFPQKLQELTVTRLEGDELRRQFLEPRSRAVGDAPELKLAAQCRKMLSAVIHTIPPEIFYAIELRLAAGGILLFHEPV